MTSLPTPDIEEAARVLRKCGPRALVSALNARVPHRITAFYRLDLDLLSNVCLHDKEGLLDVGAMVDVPLTDSFCQFALRDGSFETLDSAKDDRLVGHPYRGLVLSYHGVPVVDSSGEVTGSLCHLDYVRQPLPRSEFEYLRATALLLSPYLGKEARAETACRSAA